MDLTNTLEEMRRPLRGYCYRMLGGASDAEDAVQETMLRAVKHADRFDAGLGPLRPWVFRIASNVCIDMLRARGRRAVAMDLGPAAEAGAPLDETAGILDTTTVAVNSALQRARAALAEHSRSPTDPLDETDEAQRVLLETSRS